MRKLVNWRRRWGQTILAAGLLVTLTGCPTTPAPRPPAPTPPPAPTTPTVPEAPGGGTVPGAQAPGAQAPGAAPAAQSPAAARAEALAQVAEGVEGVRGAWVVVAGQTALVGIDPADESDRNPRRNGALEQRVAAALDRSGHGIENAYVTTRPDLIQRIQNMAVAIRAGAPMERFQAEVAKLIAELAPAARTRP